jgi:8-oxo-dGTP pyrophosphatase MutT (NUDIX family)
MELSTWQVWRTRAYLFAIGVKRHVTLGTRVVLIDGDDRVLLVKQTYIPGWHFPGGGVEAGETAETAGARELLEETGYRVKGPMALHGLYLVVNRTTNRDHIAVYICRGYERIGDFKANHEVAEAAWFPADALPETATHGTARRVAEIFGGGRPDPMW